MCSVLPQLFSVSVFSYCSYPLGFRLPISFWLPSSKSQFIFPQLVALFRLWHSVLFGLVLSYPSVLRYPSVFQAHPSLFPALVGTEFTLGCTLSAFGFGCQFPYGYTFSFVFLLLGSPSSAPLVVLSFGFRLSLSLHPGFSFGLQSPAQLPQNFLASISCCWFNTGWHSVVFGSPRLFSVQFSTTLKQTPVYFWL